MILRKYMVYKYHSFCRYYRKRLIRDQFYFKYLRRNHYMPTSTSAYTRDDAPIKPENSSENTAIEAPKRLLVNDIKEAPRIY